jgi:hypothetical protein
MKLRWLVKSKVLTVKDVHDAMFKTGDTMSRCLMRLRAENKPIRTLQFWVDTSTRTDEDAGYWEDVPEILELI